LTQPRHPKYPYIIKYTINDKIHLLACSLIEESLLDKPIGPAYNPKIEYDLKIDNGANSGESSRLKIKVRKINAVKKLSESKYSENSNYWLDDSSAVVYDLKLKFPIGKLLKDNLDDYLLYDNSYIIGSTIDIPII
jgi:hypothetical protein